MSPECQQCIAAYHLCLHTSEASEMMTRIEDTFFLDWKGVETKLKSVPGPGVKRSSVWLQLLMTRQKLCQNYVSSQVKGEKLLWNFPLSPNLLIEVFIEN